MLLSVLHVLYNFGRSIDTNARKLNKLVKKPFVRWSSSLRNFNYHQCKHDVHTTSLLTMEIFVSVLESEINSISQTQDQLLENAVSRSGEKPSSVKCWNKIPVT